MKTDQLLSHLQPRRSAFLRLGLVASLCLGVSATAIAKKGGGKPGGGSGDGGGGEPPAVGELPQQSTTPVQYSVAILDAIADADPGASWVNAAVARVFLEDVNKHGVACGVVAAQTASGANTYHGVVASTEDGLVELDVLFVDALMQPVFAGLSISGAWEINEAGQIACELSGDGAGQVYIAIADLRDSSLTYVQTLTQVAYALPGGGPAQDLNELGDVLMYEGFYSGKGRNRQFQSVYWLSTADGQGGWDAATELPGVQGAPQLNTTRFELAYLSTDSQIVRWDLSQGQGTLVDDLSALGSMYTLGLRMIDDGSVAYFKSIETSSGLLGYPVRWTPQGGLQALAGLQDPSAGPMTVVIDASKALDGSETVEILLGPTVSNDFDLQIYQPDAALGTVYPVEVLNADTSGTFSYRPTAISRPDASGHGHICGWANVSATEKGAFILTPVAAP